MLTRPNRASSGTLRYAILVDTDRGPIEGFIWRQDAKGILARIPARGISDSIYWSPDGAHAIVTDGGEIQEWVYVVDLKDGRVNKQQVGKAFKIGDCEVQRLYGQPASWVGNSALQLTVKMEKNDRESSCRNAKAYLNEVEVPLN